MEVQVISRSQVDPQNVAADVAAVWKGPMCPRSVGSIHDPLKNMASMDAKTAGAKIILTREEKATLIDALWAGHRHLALRTSELVDAVRAIHLGGFPSGIQTF